MTTDAHGQPIVRTFNAARINDRKIDELIGICRGVLFDGEVSESEAKSMLNWLDKNRDISKHWPANVIYERIDRMLADDHLDTEEQKELLDCLMEVTGEPNTKPGQNSGSTSLPLCSPPPRLVVRDNLFCFTGKFAIGTRKFVENSVITLGADTTKAPTKKTKYLVIGSIGSTDWIHSTHGRKIEKAVALRNEGTGINILNEEYWFQSIKQNA